MGSPSSKSACSGRPLDVPDDVLALILSKTSPQDAARLSAVSRRFAEAAGSDTVWRAFLPIDAFEIAQNAHPAPLVFDSAKGLYNQLSSRVHSSNGTEGYWLERKKGGVCRAFSGSALRIIWGDDPSYWTYGPKEGSRFAEVAILNIVWWLDVSHEMTLQLPPGEYTVVWVMQIEESPHRQKVSFVLGVGEEPKKWFKNKVELRGGSGWTGYNGGHFKVKRPMDTTLKVAMRNHNCEDAKTGVYVDGIVIHPGRLKGAQVQV